MSIVGCRLLVVATVAASAAAAAGVAEIIINMIFITICLVFHFLLGFRLTPLESSEHAGIGQEETWRGLPSMLKTATYMQQRVVRA